MSVPLRKRPLVRIAWEKRGVRGYDMAQTPWMRSGLAITPAMDEARGHWTITHVASGWAVIRDIHGQNVAIEATRKLLDMGDWTRDYEAIVADVDLKARAVLLRNQLTAQGDID
jgi:hypothetical protein